jgi:hypothetical protein
MPKGKRLASSSRAGGLRPPSKTATVGSTKKGPGDAGPFHSKACGLLEVFDVGLLLVAEQVAKVETIAEARNTMSGSRSTSAFTPVPFHLTSVLSQAFFTSALRYQPFPSEKSRPA